MFFPESGVEAGCGLRLRTSDGKGVEDGWRAVVGARIPPTLATLPGGIIDGGRVTGRVSPA